jgi:hypothetical protein
MSSTAGSPAPQVLTPTSGGTLTDSTGNKWTLSGTGSVQENGTPVPGGGGTAQLTLVGNVIYGFDASASGQWYSYDPASKSWATSTNPIPATAGGGASGPTPEQLLLVSLGNIITQLLASPFCPDTITTSTESTLAARLSAVAKLAGTNS